MAAALHFVLVLFFLSAIQGQCPQPEFLPSVPDSASSKQCVSSHHCSKAKCVITQGAHKLTVTLKLNWCQEPVTATVKLQQPESKLNWSSTLQDGEKAKLAVTPSMFSGGLPVSDSSLFVQVGLKKMEGNLLHYTVMMVGNITAYDVVDPVNVVLLQGQTPVSSQKCGMIEGSDSSEKHSDEDHVWHPDEKSHHEDHGWHPDEKSHDQGTCPPAHFSDGTVCPVTNHCSKITCTWPGDSHGAMVLTVQINGCSGPLTATVTMVSSLTNTSEKWSHTFENGDKAKPPMLSGDGVEVHYEFKVEWEKTIANINFKLTVSIEGKEESSEFGGVNILTAELPLPKCGGPQKWFSKQPTSVKILVIFLPVLVLVFVGLGVAFYCYRNSRKGGRFPVHLTAGGSKVAMQRLTNEI